MSLSLITAATTEPITLAQAKKQCRIADDWTDEDDFLTDLLIPAAIERAELATRRQFTTATYALRLDAPPGLDEDGGWRRDARIGFVIDVPKPPLQEVVKIEYVDTGGVTQTWDPSNYIVEAPQGPRCARGRIAPKFAVIWPIALCQLGALTVTFIAGYGDDADDVPSLLKMGMLMHLGSMYENREAIQAGLRAAAIEIPDSTSAIYKSHKSYAQHR